MDRFNVYNKVGVTAVELEKGVKPTIGVLLGQ